MRNHRRSGAVAAATVAALVVWLIPAAVAGGSVYADQVVSVTGKPMENYQGEVMTEAGYWWLTGPPDDVVSGWRSTGPPTIFTMEFPLALLDESGADLRVRCFGPGPYTVEASQDGSDFSLIGDCTTGTPGVFEDVGFDFNGLVDNVSFIRIERTVWGPQTGRFFDSFEGLHPVPEPASGVLMICGVLALLRRHRRRT